MSFTQLLILAISAIQTPFLQFFDAQLSFVLQMSPGAYSIGSSSLGFGSQEIPY
jgi:hypothetical protein